MIFLKNSSIFIILLFVNIFLNINNVNAQIYDCTFNENVTTCAKIDNVVNCPTIMGCLKLFSSQSIGQFNLNILDGSYSSSSCIGPVTIPFDGVLYLKAKDQAYFDCGDSPFINANLQQGLNLVLDGLSLSGSNSGDGGCVRVVASGFINENSNVYIYNMRQSKCVSGGNGGLLYSTLSSASIQNSTISHNEASKNGGAIYSEGSTFTTNSTISNNRAQFNGGAVFSKGNLLYTLQTNFTNNVAALSGGALYSRSKMNNIGLSKFISNNASDGDGGAISSIAQTIVYDSSFEYNSASSKPGNSSGNGGAISGCNITADYTHFIGNFASGNGGAIYSQQRAQAATYRSYFEENLSGGDGGAISLEISTGYFQNSSFNSNTAHGSGGSISMITGTEEYYFNLLDSTIENSISYTNGGALSLNVLTKEMDIDLSGSVFTDNVAAQYGGGFYFNVYIESGIVGGEFTGSKSSEPNSNTFYSKSIENQNVVNITDWKPTFYVPIFLESENHYWKAIANKGSCINGVATINLKGNVLTCTCFTGYSGPSCEQHN